MIFLWVTFVPGSKARHANGSNGLIACTGHGYTRHGVTNYCGSGLETIAIANQHQAESGRCDRAGNRVDVFGARDGI